MNVFFAYFLPEALQHRQGNIDFWGSPGTLRLLTARHPSECPVPSQQGTPVSIRSRQSPFWTTGGDSINRVTAVLGMNVNQLNVRIELHGTGVAADAIPDEIPIEVRTCLIIMASVTDDWRPSMVVHGPLREAPAQDALASWAPDRLGYRDTAPRPATGAKDRSETPQEWESTRRSMASDTTQVAPGQREPSVTRTAAAVDGPGRPVHQPEECAGPNTTTTSSVASRSQEAGGHDMGAQAPFRPPEHLETARIQRETRTFSKRAGIADLLLAGLRPRRNRA